MEETMGKAIHYTLMIVVIIIIGAVFTIVFDSLIPIGVVILGVSLWYGWFSFCNLRDEFRYARQQRHKKGIFQ